MIWTTKQGTIYLAETENGQINKKGDFIYGWCFSGVENGPKYLYQANWELGKWADTMWESESVVIPRNIGHCPGDQGALVISKATGFPYILCRVAGKDATCYSVKMNPASGRVGFVIKCSRENLELAPPGLEFEMKNPFYEKKITIS